MEKGVNLNKQYYMVNQIQNLNHSVKTKTTQVKLLHLPTTNYY